MKRSEAAEALWQWILSEWDGSDWCGDIEGLSLQDKATELGLLRREKYDPAVHGEHDMVPGEDDIYVPVDLEPLPLGGMKVRDLKLSLKHLDGEMWVCVDGRGPLKRIIKEPGANEPFVVLCAPAPVDG